MRFDPAPSLKRDLGAGMVAGIGIATFVTVYLHVQRLDTVGDPSLLLGLFAAFLSGPLVVGGLQLLRQEYEPGAVLRIAAWVLAGSGPLLAITFLLVTFSEALDIVLGDPFILLSGLVALGGLAGLAFGFYELALRQAQATIEDTANRLDAIVSGSPIPIIAVDEAGVVTMWNPAAAEKFHYDADSAIGDPYPLAPPELESEVEDHLERLRAGEELAGVETVRERRDGVRRDVELWTNRLVDDTGQFEGAVVLIVDVSERKRREQEVQVLHRVLRHNLRNDLNVIQGNAARIEETLEPLADRMADLDPPGTHSDGHDPDGEPLASTVRATVPDTIEHTRLMTRTATELVDLTEKAQRAETILRSTRENHSAIGLESLVEHPIRDLELEYPEAAFDLDLDEDLRVLVNGPVGVAVRELAENAVVHTGESTPTIRIEAFEDRERACIEIHDDGPGVPAEERRVMAAGEESAMLHSSGLGLWLANWLVNRSGGTISFEETGESGATARIELPTAEVASGD